MSFTPFALLFTWFLRGLSLAVLGGGLELTLAWIARVVAGPKLLVAGVALLLWTLLGRRMVLLARRPGPDEPHTLRPDSELRISRSDGTVLHVESHGPHEAPAVILTHGAGTDRTSWYYVIRALAGRYRVIVWDMPGLGKSSRPGDGDYSLERHARDLEAVLAIVGDRRVVLAGHSMGGMVTLTFCKLFPQQLRERVAGLVLVDTSPINTAQVTTGGRLLRTIQKPVLEPLLHLVAWLSPLLWLINWVNYLNGTALLGTMLANFAGSETRGQLDRTARYLPEAWPGVLAREVLATFHYDATEILSRIPVASLVITGNLDRVIVPETARYLVDHLPNARLVMLKPAGHMAILERHDRLIPALSRFCDEAFKQSEEEKPQGERPAA